MTSDELNRVQANIFSNEPFGREIAELSDSEIESYLLDCGLEDSAENVAAVRASTC